MVWASMFRKSRRPKRIILVRHGESEANIDPSLYDKVPDNKISLSTNGFKQAREAGEKLLNIVKQQSLQFYVSPLLRTLQTAEEMINQFEPLKLKELVDPRLREQEWGNFQNQEKMNTIFKERDKVGKFYYRFKEGESGADVYDRVSSFLESLFREIDNHDRKNYDNIVLVTHGLFMRLFIMRYFKLTISKFEKMLNPTNCEMWILEKNKDGKYELKTNIREYETEPKN